MSGEASRSAAVPARGGAEPDTAGAAAEGAGAVGAGPREGGTGAARGRGTGADAGAAQPPSGAATGMFPRVGRWTRGYDVRQVDEFFADARRAYEGPLESALSGGDVRRAAFDLVRGGYATGAVDAALDRLEGAFVRRQRAAFVVDHNQQQWMSAVAERATTLYPRLVRPAGSRFAPPASGAGYAAADVDRLLELLVEYFDRGAPLTAAEVRAATFGSARGRRAYAEGPVDAFLDRVVEILLAVE